MNMTGIIEYDTLNGFHMAEGFRGDGAILEEVLEEMQDDGCTNISITFCDLD